MPTRRSSFERVVPSTRPLRSSNMESSPPPAKRRSPRIDAEKKCRTAAKQLANAVSERVWGLAVAPDGEEYYYHLATNATAWSLPAGAILQADGDTYVSEQQHRISPKVSPKISPKAKASPKARVAATSGSPKSPKSRIDAAAATPPQKPPTKPHTEADAGDEPPDAAEAKAMEEEEEAAQEEEAEEHTSVQASRMRTLLASVQEQLQQSEMRRAESAAELQV